MLKMGVLILALGAVAAVATGRLGAARAGRVMYIGTYHRYRKARGSTPFDSTTDRAPSSRLAWWPSRRTRAS